jgi:hypothetical protein
MLSSGHTRVRLNLQHMPVTYHLVQRTKKAGVYSRVDKISQREIVLINGGKLEKGPPQMYKLV